jgi:hypothetical protein
VVHVCLAVLFALVIFFTPTLTYIFHIFGLVWGAAMCIIFIDCFLCLPAMLSIVGPYDMENPKFNGKIMDEANLNEDQIYRKDMNNQSSELIKVNNEAIVFSDIRNKPEEADMLLDDLVAEGSDSAAIRPVEPQEKPQAWLEDPRV